MEKLLIVGAAGCTARHFGKYLTDKKLPHDIIVKGYDIAASTQDPMPVMISDFSNMNNALQIIEKERPDYIINLAGRFDSGNYDELYKANVLISKNIFDSILQLNIKVKKILLIGSAAEYGPSIDLPLREDSVLNPVSNYGKTKMEQTCLAREYFDKYDLNICLARTFNIFAYDLSTSISVGSFADQINKAADGGSIAVGNLETRRDFLLMHDVVNAYYKLLMHGKAGEVYNVCSGISLKIKDILQMIINASGKKINIITDPGRIRQHEVMDNYGDNSKIVNELGWTFDRFILE
jgi:GDP-4-dehydro-6-deoxy-D-mannose reductase